MKNKLKKYQVAGQAAPQAKSFETWVAEQDLPPGADLNMFRGAYDTYLKNFAASNNQQAQTKQNGDQTLEYNDFFKDFNKILDITQLIGGTINDINSQRDEKNRLLKAQYPKSSYNVNQAGINNVPVYYQNGGTVKQNDKDIAAAILNKGEIAGRKLSKKQKEHFKAVLDGKILLNQHLKDAKKANTYQTGGEESGGWWSSIKRDLFGIEPEAKKSVVIKMPQQYNIKDERTKSLTTGKDINPNTELLSGKYPAERIFGIVQAAKQYNIDPYTALAIDLQETGFGTSKRNGNENIGHVNMRPDQISIPSKLNEGEDDKIPYDYFVRALATKMEYADKLGITDPLTKLQVYNGVGKIRPETEKNYHGFKMNSIYGVPIPKEGIDMKQNPLYGKRITDIRDNILKKDENLAMFVRNIKKTGGPVTIKKAKEILKDGTIYGQPLTDKQRGYFGFIAGGGKPKMQYAGTVDMINNANIIANQVYENGAYIPTMQIGGGNYVNNTGYLDGAPTSQNPYNIIPSNVLTMQGVSQDIMAYPNVGEPMKMKANDKQKYTFPNADYVVEMPASGNSLNTMGKGGKMCEMCGGKKPCKCGGKVKMANGGYAPIEIDPNKKGTFKAQATRMGMSTHEAAKHILANKEDYSPAMIKKATFAYTFAKEQGGEMMHEHLEEMATGGIPERYRKLGFTKVGAKRQSNRPGKKWMVLAKKGDQYKIVHGGYKGMQDYTQHHSEQRRENFWNRMGGKNSAKAHDPFSPLYWHKRFGTWQEGGEIEDQQMNQQQMMQMLQQFADMNGMKVEDLMAKLKTVPTNQLQQVLQDIADDVKEGVNKQDDTAQEQEAPENNEAELEIEQMQNGGQGASLLDALMSAYKATNVPQDYKFIGEKEGKKYYGKTTTSTTNELKPAQNYTTGPKGGKQYEDFLINLLQSGTSPQELRNKGYIGESAVNQYSKYYVQPQTKSDYLYTEQQKPAAPIQTFEGENVYSGNKAFGKVAYKFRDATNADLQSGTVNTMSQPVKEFYFRTYKPNTAEIDYNAPMYKIPAQAWHEMTAGTTNLSKPEMLKNYQLSQYQTGGIQQMGGVSRDEANAYSIGDVLDLTEKEIVALQKLGYGIQRL